MGVIYLAALIVGLGISLIQVLMSSSDTHAADAAAGDVHGDFGGHVDGDIAHGGEGGAHAPGAGFAAVFLSLRFWTFGALAFGLVGTLLTYLHLASPVLTAVLACSLGLVSGAGASWTFRVLGASSIDSGAQAGELLGQTGRVLLRIGSGVRGKIRVSVRGQDHDYLAVTDEDVLHAGESVMIEAVEGDTVRVCRTPDELRLPSGRSDS